MLINKIRNRYDIMIIILLSSMAFGNIGGSLQLCRIFTLLFLPQFVQKFNYSRSYILNYWYFFVFFIGYSSLSLLWTPDKLEGLVQSVYFIIHFLFFFEIIVFSMSAVNAIDSISKGWMISVALTLFVALWEIITDNHLSISAQESERIFNNGSLIVQQKFASVTFYNYNSYVTYLCFAMPFIYYRLICISKFHFKKIIPILIILLSVLCIVCNASRGGILTMATMFLIYILRQPKTKFTYLSVFILIAACICFVIKFSDTLFLIITARSTDGGLFEGSSRFSIWIVAFKTFVNTMGFGTGIGGINAGMSKFTTGINIPHNLFLEILTEFGIVIFTIFICFLLWLYKKTHKLQNKQIKTLLYIALLPLPIYCIIDSRYLLNYWVFAFFASVICFVNYKHYNLTIG